MAAFHAYKFTHFYTDSEFKPKKPEEMGWWDKTSAVLFGINYAKSKNDIKPDTAFEAIKLKTKDGLNIECWHMKQNDPKGTVILFHGHGSSKSKILDEAAYMFYLGFNTLLVDFRAHGGSEGKTCTIGYEEAEEVKLAFDYVKENGEKNISLWGISMGAAAISRAISEYKLEPSRIILEMPFGSLKEAVNGRVRIMGLPEEPVATLLTFWGGTEQGFWAFGHNPCEYAKDIRCPVLLQWGALDPRVTKKETREIFDNLATDRKKLVVYTESKHESLCDKEGAKWKREVAVFMSADQFQ
jgi:hypothetical protein